MAFNSLAWRAPAVALAFVCFAGVDARADSDEAEASLASVPALAKAGDAADSCIREKSPGDPFVVCFDPGNRLRISASSQGVGAAILVRHRMLFDDEPDLSWKLEHQVLATEVSYGRELDSAFYQGRFIRHARDGHIVLPFGLPRKLFVPFDVGAEVGVARLRGSLEESGDDANIVLDVITAAALVDLIRGDDFRKRVAIGIVSNWTLEATRNPRSVAEHIVTPLSSVILDLHFESRNGLTQLSARSIAGAEWSTIEGWRGRAEGEISGERVVVAVNDKPVSVFAQVKYEGALNASIGLRLAAF